MSTPATRWEPHTVVDQIHVDPHRVEALHALFDDGLPLPTTDSPLPPLWHWAALSRWSSSSLLAMDGHPAKGSFLPPIELPRRMFAGGEVRFHHRVTVGATLRRESRVDAVEHKTGRSGEFAVVKVVTDLFDGSTLCWSEIQNIIYRPAVVARTPSSQPPVVHRNAEPAGPPLRQIGDWEWRLRTDPTLLMRFSAATSNAHRIHYDWPYATGVEGYPGLVVQGPLMTLCLAEVARLEGVEGTIFTLQHRNMAPFFGGDVGTIRRLPDSEPSDGSITIQLLSDETPRTSMTLWVKEPH